MSANVTTTVNVSVAPIPLGWQLTGDICHRGKPPIKVAIFVPDHVAAALKEMAQSAYQYNVNRWMRGGGAGKQPVFNGNVQQFGGFFDDFVDVVHTVASSDIIKAIPYVGTVATVVQAGTGIYQGIRDRGRAAGKVAGLVAKGNGANADQVKAISLQAAAAERMRLQTKLEGLAKNSEEWRVKYESAKKAAKVNQTFRGRKINPFLFLASSDANAKETGAYLLAAGKDVKLDYPVSRPLVDGELDYAVSEQIADPESSWGTV